MKRWMSIAAVFLCLCLFAFPAEGAANSSAYGVYRTCMMQMDTITSLEMSGSMKSSSKGSVNSYEYDFTHYFTMQLRYHSENQMEFALIKTQKGSDYQTASYYKDGYLYEYADGKLMEKTRTTKEDALYLLPYSSSLMPKGSMKGLEMTTVEDGRQIKYKLNTSDPNYSATYTMTFGEDNWLKTYKLSSRTLSSRENSSSEGRFSVNARVNSINKLDSIAFPAEI